jgi:hypothetical protein
VEYSLGWSIGEPERTAIAALPTSAWSPAIDADGQIREGAQVAELTGLLHLPGWPAKMRVIVRRERPHPGAQLSLFEERDGWRYTAFVTNTQVGALQWLEARHRAHARVEDRIVLREGHRPGPAAVPRVRHQRRLVHRGGWAACRWASRRTPRDHQRAVGTIQMAWRPRPSA